jgi:hypothetical protein
MNATVSLLGLIKPDKGRDKAIYSPTFLPMDPTLGHQQT